jgi:hypothetical protein
MIMPGYAPGLLMISCAYSGYSFDHSLMSTTHIGRQDRSMSRQYMAPPRKTLEDNHEVKAAGGSAQNNKKT